MLNFQTFYCLSSSANSFQACQTAQILQVLLRLMTSWDSVGVLSQPIPPLTFPNPILNFQTFHSYVPTYLCFIFVQPCLFPICIFCQTPQSFLPHDLMFCLNLSLISFVFTCMSYPLVHYIDPTPYRDLTS